MTGNGEGSLPSFSETAAARRRSLPAASMRASASPVVAPQWTASAEFIILERIGTADQTLVSTYPGALPILHNSIVGQGTDRLYSGDLTQGFAGGPKIGLMHHGEDGYDLEISFFEIDGWNNAAEHCLRPDYHAGVRGPGGFVQTTDSPTQYMEWWYATKLYNAEINVHWDLCSRVTMLAGFRWVNLSEELQGYVLPLTASETGPFWDNTTRNNLFGLQLGEDWKILNAWSVFRSTGWLRPGFSTTCGRDDRSEHLQDRVLGVRLDQSRRLPWRNRPAVQVSSYPAARAQGWLRSDVAAGRCHGARPDSGNPKLRLHRLSSCKPSASIAAPACSIRSATAGLEYSF